MKKSLSALQLSGYFFVTISGVLLHFLYDWTNESKISALISGVNESTWEHMKLLFFPLFVFAIIESFFIKRSDFWCIKFIGTLCGIFLIPIIFYTLNGIFGKTPDWLNITIFFISAAIAFIIEGILFKMDTLPCTKKSFVIFCFLLISVLFFVFTFYPPKIPIFCDPVTNQYGI